MATEAPSTTRRLAEVLARTPDVFESLTATHTAATGAISSRLYELCRLRVAMLLGTPDELETSDLDPATVEALPKWPNHDTFDEADRACLAFTEQFVVDVASMPDELAEAVADQLGGDGFADFVHALLALEQRQRLRLIWDQLEINGALS